MKPRIKRTNSNGHTHGGFRDFRQRKTTLNGESVHLRSNFKHEPSDAIRYEVAMMAAFGINRGQIAKIIGINRETLRRYYQEELDLGQDRATCVVGSKLFRTAITGKGKEALHAQMFWLKTRGKGQFKEVSGHELSGPDGAPISTAEFLTDEERAVRLLQLINSGAKGGIRRLAFDGDGGVGSSSGSTDASIRE